MKAQARERRLLGTWRSDTKQTFRYWLFAENVSQEGRRRFKRIFGKLTHTYTPSRMVSDFRGGRTVYSYEVLGKDGSSVAIRYWKRGDPEGEIMHIHFAGPHYWIVTAAGQREFFRRMPKAVQPTRAAKRLRSTGGSQKRPARLPPKR